MTETKSGTNCNTLHVNLRTLAAAVLFALTTGCAASSLAPQSAGPGALPHGRDFASSIDGASSAIDGAPSAAQRASYASEGAQSAIERAETNSRFDTMTTPTMDITIPTARNHGPMNNSPAPNRFREIRGCWRCQ